MGRRTSIYLPEQLDERIRQAGVPLAELLRRGLDASEPDRLGMTVRAAVREEIDAGPPPWWDEDRAEEEQRAPVCERCGTALACPQCYRGD